MMMHKEADYEREMTILEHYYESLKNDKRFIVPKPYKKFSSGKVIAMSFEQGCKIDSLIIGNLSQERRNKLGASFMDLMFKEIFSWRLVQTDPHFGNYRIRIAKSSENDKVILRIRAEWAEDVEYWKGQIEDTVNREKLLLATEVCQLRELLLAR